MPSELQVLPLEDCLEALIDYRGKTPRKTDSGIPLITAKVVKGGRIETPTEFIAPEDFDSWMTRGLPRIGDVVMTTEAPLGEVGQILRLPVALAQRIVTLRGKPHLLDNDYLLYLLQAEAFQEQLKGRSSGTTVVGIKQSELRKVRLHLPSVQLQREVASILKALDRRIDLLRQTNATLESIAQALFKSWFIDFDPVRAKAEGREPEGMDAATAALFPAEFEESALGLIPKGWRASKAGDVFRITMGQSPPGETYNQEGVGLPFYQGRADFGFRFPDVRVYCTAPTRHAREGDVLVSVRAPVGDVNVALESCAIGRGVAAVGLNGAPSFALYSMKALRDRFAEYESHGTVFGSINKKQFEALPCVIPSPEVLAAFTCTAGALDDRVRVNELQVRSLTEARDSLLPRLISGKLRLPEAQEQVEDALA